MSERIRGEEKINKDTELKEKEKENFGKRFTEQTMRSAIKLINRRPEKVKKYFSSLPREYDLGATLVPTILFSLMTGCRVNPVECTDSQSEYIETLTDWIVSNPEILQEQMDTLWSEQTITAKDLTGTLERATIECGMRGVTGKNIAGKVYQTSDRIILAVDGTALAYSMQDFQDVKWVGGNTLDDLVASINIEGKAEMKDDVRLYWESLAVGARTLAHEAAHLATNRPHKVTDHLDALNTVEELNEKIKAGEVSFTTAVQELGTIDEIYGWGSSSALGAMATEQEYLDALEEIKESSKE